MWHQDARDEAPRPGADSRNDSRRESVGGEGRFPFEADTSNVKGYRALLRLWDAAEGGDATAMVRLGKLLWRGEDLEAREGEDRACDVKKDEAEARRWLRRASSLGAAEGMNMLGCILYRGTERDRAEAPQWFRRAAAAGLAKGISNTALCLRFGRGVEKDVGEALRLFREAAAGGYADSYIHLGVMTRDGVGVEKDAAESVRLFRMGAERGSLLGMFELGRCYRYGLGTRVSPGEALRWFSKASELGNAESSAWLGDMYDEGVAPVVDRDVDRAFRLYESSHRQGCFRGTCGLGRCLLWGRGTARDERRGVALVREALSKGRVARAAWVLGDAYREGVGVSRDARRAVKLYRQAAECQVVEAMERLAECLFFGIGCAMDRAEAGRWIAAARDQRVERGEIPSPSVCMGGCGGECGNVSHVSAMSPRSPSASVGSGLGAGLDSDAACASVCGLALCGGSGRRCASSWVDVSSD